MTDLFGALFWKFLMNRTIGDLLTILKYGLYECEKWENVSDWTKTAQAGCSAQVMLRQDSFVETDKKENLDKLNDSIHLQACLSLLSFLTCFLSTSYVPISASSFFKNSHSSSFTFFCYSVSKFISCFVLCFNSS